VWKRKEKSCITERISLVSYIWSTNQPHQKHFGQYFSCVS